MYNMKPWEAREMFTHRDNALFRLTATKHWSRATTLSGGRVVLLVRGERIAAVDIVWALAYGNWPKFPLVTLDDDPQNLALANIYPARLKKLRYRETRDRGGFKHPLCDLPFESHEACRADWIRCARRFYETDLPYVLHIEASERDLIAPDVERIMAERKIAAQKADKERKERMRSRYPAGIGKPSRPPYVKGMAWHWVGKEWLSIPESCHVADDFRVRIAMMKLGAVRFAFNPDYQEVWGYGADGAVIERPADLLV